MKNLKEELVNVDQNINQLEKDRKYYKLQSEWLKMIYPLYLKKELLEKLINEQYN